MADVTIQPQGQRVILRTDGAARGNPGPAAAGFVVQQEQGETLARGKRYLGILTNNQAEYRALILGLQALAAFAPSYVQVRMDSELVIKQMRGEYRVKSPDLLPLYTEARQLATALPSIRFTHVPRAENHVADQLANDALDEHKRGADR